MSYIDTRDLHDKREELKEELLAEYNRYFPYYPAEDYDSIPKDGFTQQSIVDLCTVAVVLEDINIVCEDVHEWLGDNADTFSHIKEIDDLESECSEFQHGCTLIPYNDFEGYCKELLEDCGYISKDLPGWIEIDWTRTAANIEQDYSTVDYQGTTYLFRN